MGGLVTKGKAAAKAPNLRDKLSLAFLTAFDNDFQQHGVDVIQQLREKDPVKYAELASRLITAVQDPADPSNFSHCETEEDIVRKLLTQVGVHDDAMTPDMLRLAADANSEFLARLLTIAEGN